MENYEALGRYITAAEQADKFIAERNKHLYNAKVKIERSTFSGSSYSLGYDFDAGPIQEELTKAAEAHQNMLVAMNEANLQAGLCGKSKLQLLPAPK